MARGTIATAFFALLFCTLSSNAASLSPSSPSTSTVQGRLTARSLPSVPGLNTAKVSYGNPSFLICRPNPNYLTVQIDTCLWYQDGMKLVESQEPNLSFDNLILDVTFVESRREGLYECSYQLNASPTSRVNGTSDPMFLIVRGIPEFAACLGLGWDEKCFVTDEPILFYIGEELDIPVEVEYVGAGGLGCVFEVVGVSISRPVLGTLMGCSTTLPSTDGGDVDFSCNPTNADVEDRINGRVSTDRKTYMNASFVINPASVNDSGDYTVRVTARDTSEVIKTISSTPTTTTATTHTTITMVVSASPTVHPPTPTPSVDIPKTIEPPLKIVLVNDSPLVHGNNVTAFISSNKPVSYMECKVSGVNEAKNCTSGLVEFNGLPPRAMHTLKVFAETEEGEIATIKRQFSIEQEGYCTAHLINEGVSVEGNKVTVEFTLSGDTERAFCILDPPATKENQFYRCTSPVVMYLSPGPHTFKIVPKGCGAKRQAVKMKFEV